MNQLREAAEELREQGYSYSIINKELGVAKSTMSYWFKDKPFTPNKEVLERVKSGPMKSGMKRHNQRLEQTARLKSVGVKEVGLLSRRDLWMLGLGIYIGEGSKTVEAVCIANSDPLVIAIMVRWLREICDVPSANLVVKLHLYPDNDIEDAHSYWQEVTGLPRESFRPPYIDIRENKQRSHRRKLPHGTVDLRVVCRGDATKGAQLYRKLSGWMTGALNQI